MFSHRITLFLSIAFPWLYLGELFLSGNFPIIDSVRVLDDLSDTQVDFARGSPSINSTDGGRFRLGRS